VKIGIDLDGVIADNVPELVYRLKKLGIKTDPKKWPSYYIEDHIEGLPEGWASDQFNDPLFYQNCIATEHAFYAVNEWFYAGNDIFIITSRRNHLEEVTLDWLDQWSIPYNQLFMGVKRLEKYKILENLEATVMIEDHPHEAMVAKERGYNSFLLMTPYNKNFKYGDNKPHMISDLYGVTARLAQHPDFKTRRKVEGSLFR
jgi:uncharacterized HAD superfamily protein